MVKVQAQKMKGAIKSCWGFFHASCYPTDIASLSRKVNMGEITEQLGDEFEVYMDKEYEEKDNITIFG